MADNIKTFVIGWLLIGLFSVSMLSFVVLFPVHQGRGVIYENDTRINQTLQDLEEALGSSRSLANTNLNLTKEYDPQTSFSGSDFTQVGQGINLLSIGTSIKNSLQIFIYYSLGEASVILLGVLSTIFLISGIYFLTKYFRSGQ